VWDVSAVVGLSCLSLPLVFEAWVGKVRLERGKDRLTDLWRGYSIREFCELSVPIIMFDKDSNFVVMKLGEVSTSHSTSSMRVLGCVDRLQLLPLSFGPEALGAPDPARS
jgi:hypothetical protein